jgi:hypothetical protein
MESSSPRNASSLSSIIDAEKIIAPARARGLLASLAQATSIPAGPSTVREWSDAILVEREEAGERATFAPVGGLTPPGDHDAEVMRHIDGMRAAAVAMLWGRESAQGPDGKPRYPRLRKLLVDQWDDTRGSCDGPDKLMMFFDATLALDRAAEPRAGREGFKTLSIESMQAAKKDKRVGTIGVPFEAIIETGKFKKAARPAPADQASPRPNQGPWPTPQVPTITQSPDPLPREVPSRPAARSMTPIIAAVVVVVVLAALGFLLSR